MVIRVWLVLALSLFAAACTPAGIGGQRVVDGYPLGARVSCDAGDCDRFLSVAEAWLDRMQPGHPAVTVAEVYRTEWYDSSGHRIIMNRSGGTDLIVVLDLAGGMQRAVLTGCCVGIDPNPCFELPHPSIP